MNCEFCGNDQYPQPGQSDRDIWDLVGTGESTGNVTLTFDSGRSYVVPDNICHHVIAHEYQPSTSLIGDVMNARYVFGGVANTYGSTDIVVIDENYPQGAVPPAFPWRLKEIVVEACRNRDRGAA